MLVAFNFAPLVRACFVVILVWEKEHFIYRINNGKDTAAPKAAPAIGKIEITRGRSAVSSWTI